MLDHPGLDQLLHQLRADPFFNGLNEAMLQDFARRVQWREYAVGEVVFLEAKNQQGCTTSRQAG